MTDAPVLKSPAEAKKRMDRAITMNPDAAPDVLAGVARLAEQVGFSCCYIADQGFSRDVYVTLTMLASATRKISLGPGVTHPYSRHPAVAAVAIAALDELSGGRAFLGIGAGGFRTLGPMALKQEQPMRACREAVEIARLLWRGGNVNYTGAHFQLAEAHLSFACRPDIEIHWAARGPKMLGLGGELAQVVTLNGIPRFELSHAVTSVREGAAKAGRSVRIRYAFSLVYDAASRERARMRTAYRLVSSPAPVRERLGITPELVAQLEHLVNTQGPRAAAHLIGDDVVNHYIVEGSPETCAATLRSLVREHRLDGLIVEIPAPDHADTLLPLAADVIGRI